MADLTKKPASAVQELKMPVDLSGKRIIITGAATGIGRSTALRVSAAGAKIAAFDVNDDDAALTMSDIHESGGDARYWHVDVRDETAVAGAVAAAESWLGGVDVLIHVAGVLQGAGVDLFELPEATWDTVLDINLRGSFTISKYVSGVMKKQGAGVIILTASGAGVMGGSSSFAYGSSKGGVHGLALVMEANLTKYGIRVNDVLPGAVDTPLKVANVEDMHEACGRAGNLEEKISALVSPDEISKVYAFLASDEANMVKGSVRTR
ncbi:MAG TPA: SDR family oxidoreductase [Dehalococcoidia bacterium]|nr:SDR family oxidoreductase [Dehalococcoidia bacterium]HIK88865.1 SDR family oxidoreductase [Dehalococcoidia bacterium]